MLGTIWKQPKPPVWPSITYLAVVVSCLLIIHVVHRFAKAKDNEELSRIQLVITLGAFIIIAIAFIWHFGMRLSTAF